jgi:hypothetical protein
MEATLVLYCCKENHLHAALRLEGGGQADDEVIGIADDWPDLKAICRDDHGRFAPCGGSGGSGGTGRTASERREQQQQSLAAAKKLIDKVRARGDKPTVKETQKLHEHLSGLTVVQLKALKADYGLKASGKNKEALVDRIKSRISEKADKEANPRAAKRPQPFKDGAEGHAWGEEAYGKWREKLTDGEREAIDTYKGNDYYKINKDKSFRADGKPPAGYEQITKDLDSALAKGKSNKDIVVYRGISHEGTYEKIKENVGGTITDRAYQSTSVDKKIAGDFSVHATVEIHVPKGSRGAYVDGTAGTNSYEREFLLPRGSKYRIISIDKRSGKDHVIARLEE